MIIFWKFRREPMCCAHWWLRGSTVSRVWCFYNIVISNTILNKTATKVEHRPDLELPKATLHITFIGELLGVYCEWFGKWRKYHDGTAMHISKFENWLWNRSPLWYQSTLRQRLETCERKLFSAMGSVANIEVQSIQSVIHTCQVANWVGSETAKNITVQKSYPQCI